MKKLIAIIDYEMGNVHSVKKALESVTDASVEITGDPQKILSANRVVFPGQSAISGTMNNLREKGLVEVIKKVAHEKPFFGMCIAPQALMEWSEENGGVECLGIFPGNVRGFSKGTCDNHTGVRLKIPHMGWNRVWQTVTHDLWHGIDDGSWFYFVHSFYLNVAKTEQIAGLTEHGIRFPAAIYQGYIFATQFHPEKSSHNGLRLLSNFCSWNP